VQAARVIDFADGLAESVLESIARVLFHQLRLAAPELQVEIRGEHGFIARVDFRWRQLRTVAEVDGALKYDADRGRARAAAPRQGAARGRVRGRALRLARDHRRPAGRQQLAPGHVPV
jgi:hypothetical protein